MIEMRMYGCVGDTIRADRTEVYCWIRGVDTHGDEATLFVSPEQARQIIDVFEGYASRRTVTQPCPHCGDEIDADAARCVTCDIAAAKP